MTVTETSMCMQSWFES